MMMPKQASTLVSKYSEEEEYYIVKVKLKEVKAFDGSHLHREDEVAWLGMSEGYPSVGSDQAHAHKFDTPPLKTTIAKWDGMPWYCRIKEAEIYKITNKTDYDKRTYGPIEPEV
jgi:hypothetical protein